MPSKRSSPKRRKSPARPAKAAPPAKPDDATRFQAAPSRAAPAHGAVLRVVRCPDERLVRQAFAVGAEDVTLGRDASCTISLGDPDVSRQHARIVRTGNSHVLVDMESTNGTRLNGEPVSEATLREGDEVQLGGTVLVYQA